MVGASHLIAKLEGIADPLAIPGVRRFFRGADQKTEIMGVQIGKVFPVAKQFVGLDLD